MNLRRPPPANSVISNPFGAPNTNNDTSATGAGLFGRPDSQSQDNNDLFVSDAPQHSGIQFEEDSTTNGMFMADPAPQ